MQKKRSTINSTHIRTYISVITNRFRNKSISHKMVNKANILMQRNLINIISGLLICLSGFIAGCSKMDDTYKQFLEGGQKKYVGKADSVKVLSGRDRVYLQWLRSADPSVVKAKIYWNAKSDSLEVPIDRNADTILVPVPNLREGNYTFQIYTYDLEGNRSVMVEAFGTSYGDKYASLLLTRPIEKTLFLNDSTLEVTWGPVSDTSLLGNELLYGDQKVVFVPKSATTTLLQSFKGGMLKYRSLFKPDKWSIDTFYTAYDSIRVKGQPIELSKNGWTATASSFDNRSGANYRPPSNTIDNNSATLWVNFIGTPAVKYPHWLQIDMGSVQKNVEGFVIITRVGDAAARAKTVELLTSLDGSNWQSFGDYILQNNGDKQFLSFSESTDARYFKMIAKDAHDGGNNIALAEIGVFTR